MKKIKTVTFHRAHNYGAVLQAYALQQFFKALDFETKIIDYINPMVDKMYRPFYNPYNDKKNGFKRFIRNCIYYLPIKKRYNAFNSFIENNLDLTEKVYSINDINNIVSDEILVTGSDQVWNLNLTDGLSDVYTLNFGKGKKISYAASVGNNKLLFENTEVYKNKLKSIDHISVREKSTQDILNSDDFKLNASQVLDPVFLLNKEKWEELVKKHSNEKINDKYIFVYMLKVDKNLVEGANYISNKTGLPIIDNELRNKGFVNRIKSVFTKGPWEFLNYLINAEYVVTQSFHAAVFSIIFHKKVFVIPHKVNGVRTKDLLEKFDLSNRNFNSVEDLKKKNIDEKIDWNYIQNKLDIEIEESVEWVTRMLKENN